MNSSGNLFFLSGFEPKDLDSYIKACAPGLPEGLGDCVRSAVMDDSVGLDMDAWVYVEGESMNGVNVRLLKAQDPSAPRMAVYIPWAASGMDVYLGYGLLNAISQAHPGLKITVGDDEGNPAGEEASVDEAARDAEFLDRLNMFASMLEMPESYAMIPTMDGEWKLDIKHYRKVFSGLPVEEKVTRLLYDIVDYIWYR